MTLAAPTALALGRALFLAALAAAVSGWLGPWLAARRGRTRVLAWTLLFAPFFTPALLISYAFSKFALRLPGASWSHEALYLAVLALKLLPVAVVVRVLLPSPLTAAARHFHAMLDVSSWWTRARFRWRSAGRGPWCAAGIVFLLAFVDFELASLWNVRTWTVAIFDAQIGGLALGETLRLAAGPLAVQLAALALGARASGRWGKTGILPVPPGAAGGMPTGRTGWKPVFLRIAPGVYLGAAAFFVAVLPLALIAVQAVAGWRTLAGHFVLTREIGASVFFALGAALVAHTATRLARGPQAVLLLAAPGLLGALTVALLALALFQLPLLRPAYDTPLPLILALVLVLLPLAFLLRALAPRPTPAVHLARQTGSRRLLWPLQTRARLIAFGLLFCWAWFDFTAASILAPVGFTPVFVRLHNLAHYGQTAVLSAMLLAACAVPVFAVLLAGAGARLWSAQD